MSGYEQKSLFKRFTDNYYVRLIAFILPFLIGGIVLGAGGYHFLINRGDNPDTSNTQTSEASEEPETESNPTSRPEATNTPSQLATCRNIIEELEQIRVMGKVFSYDSENRNDWSEVFGSFNGYMKNPECFIKDGNLYIRGTVENMDTAVFFTAISIDAAATLTPVPTPTRTPQPSATP